MSALLKVKVAEVNQVTPLIREFTLVAENGELPGFSCGSHVVVQMPLGGRTLRNAYSLLSEPGNRQYYRIAVRLQEQSRGGSQFMHQRVQAGDRLQISVPHNLFPLDSRARHHVLIAGGIGITPFMSYSAELQARGESYELHYAYRGGLTDAYAGHLRESLGERLHCYDAQARQRLDLRALLSRQPLGTHVYTCGPQALLQAVQEQAQALGWPAGRVHWEAFASPEPGLSFTVQLASSRRQIEVPADYSLLEALEQEGVEVPNLCRGGVCGQCATRYLEGDVEHRDLFLAEQERSTHLMPCVSRGACRGTLLLDL